MSDDLNGEVDEYLKALNEARAAGDETAIFFESALRRLRGCDLLTNGETIETATELTAQWIRATYGEMVEEEGEG